MLPGRAMEYPQELRLVYEYFASYSSNQASLGLSAIEIFKTHDIIFSQIASRLYLY